MTAAPRQRHHTLKEETKAARPVPHAARLIVADEFERFKRIGVIIIVRSTLIQTN